MSWTQMVKAVLAIAAIVAIFWLVWTIKSILVPFGFAALLAYLLNPSVRTLHQRGLNRAAGAGVAVLVLVLVLLFMLFIPWPIISKQMTILQVRLPEMLTHVQSLVANSVVLKEWLPANGVDTSSWFEQLRAYVTENVNFSNVSKEAWGYFKTGSSVIIDVLTWLVLMPIITYYLLANWPRTVKELRRWLPQSWRPDAFRVTKEMDLVLAQFVRGQLLVMLALSVYYATALRLTGLEVGVFIGVLTGCFAIIPFVGFGLGFVLGALSAMLQFGFTPPFFAVLAIYGVGQVLESYVLTPRLVGERIGLSPVAVIFSLLVFSALFGFLGVLFALPAAAVVAVLVRHWRLKYFNSAFYYNKN